jgi:spore germination protein YaaH
MKKKIVTMIIFLLLSVLISLSKSYAINISEQYHMKDISDHWAREHINELVYMGILKGYNLKAEPDSKITRAEFISLLVNAMNLGNYQVNGKQHFKDVGTDKWYYVPIATAYENGIVRGYGDNTFLPNRFISREEIVITVINALKIPQNHLNSISFNDIDENYSYKYELNTAVGAGIITGYNDNTFRPKNNALRSEAAVIIRKMLEADVKTENPSEEKKAIENLIYSYINEYLDKKNNMQSDIDFNIDNSTGKAKEDNITKSRIINYFNEKGYKAIEDIKNLNIEVENIFGCIAKATAVYDVNYKRFLDNSSSTKDYKGKKEFSLIKINDTWKVYNVNESLFKDGKINMVWDQISVKTPDMSGVEPMEGLNIISPTWFELRNDDNVLGVKQSDPVVFSNWQGKIHMVDMGDMDYMNWARQNGYHVWGLFRNEFDIEIANKVLNSKESRDKMVKILLDYTWKYGLDGINIDFENIYFNDRYVLSQFVRELAFVLREQGVITSIDVTKIEPGSWTWSMCYDRRALGESVDYVALMAYDQNGSWSKKSGSVAQITWVERALSDMLKQVAPEKTLLGLPFYTVLWEEENGKLIKSSVISMETSQRLIRENNAHLVWDNVSGQHIATYKKGNSTFKIWVEDGESIRLKASLVDKYGISGVASWRRGLETSDIWIELKNSLN